MMRRTTLPALTAGLLLSLFATAPLGAQTRWAVVDFSTNYMR